MLRKIANLIFNNLGLKIAAAVLAVIFWMVILNIEDPDKTKVFTVEVEIENEEYLTEMGKTYEILNGTNTISFTATGRRSVIESLEASDFKATADLEDIVNMSEVPITITAKRYSSSLDISDRTQYLELNVENLVTETFGVTAQTTGEMGAEYTVDSMSASPGSIIIEGPESVVEEIESVIALVDVSSMEDDFVQSAAVYLYDADGDEVSQERLTLNHTEVTVTVSVLQTKTVSLLFETAGDPPDGYRVSGVAGSVSEIAVTGKPSAVADLESITVSGSDLLVSSMTETEEVTIDIRDYLPDGVSLASEEDEEITVTIEIEGMVEESYNMPSDNITVENLGDGLTCTFDDSKVTVTLEGYAEDLADINAGDLTGTVDLDGLEEGEYTVAVTLDGGYEAAKTIRVSLTLTAEEASGEEE